MKKFTALLLVLCMAVACFAFAPASADDYVYRPNLLTYTEQNISSIMDRNPWEANSIDKLYAWGYPGTVLPNAWKTVDGGNGSAGFSFTTEADEVMPVDNRYFSQQPRAIKAHIADMKIESNLPHLQGNILDVYTDKCEPGKTYTFFFKVKLSEDATPGAVAIGVFDESSLTDLVANPQYVYSNIDNTTHVVPNVTATTEWQTVKYTFTTKSPLAGPYTGIRINVGKAAETSGYLYIDGLTLVEGTISDAEIEQTYAYTVLPDTDGDGIFNDYDPDVDGDGILNKYDRDIDGDGTKNVWDRDIDGDFVDNKEDDIPFGG